MDGDQQPVPGGPTGHRTTEQAVQVTVAAATQRPEVGLRAHVGEVLRQHGAMVAVIAGLGPGPAQRHPVTAAVRARALSVAIARERRAARALDTLRGHGWTVLHDRLLVGTEHRVGHVLVGPAGVVVANVLPVDGPLRMEGDVLHTGDVPLVDWFSSRWWEANTMNAALMQRLPEWPWTGPVHPVAMYPGVVTSRWRRVLQPPQAKRAPAGPTHPAVYARMTVREPERVRAWVTSLPSPLGRLAAAQLAAEVESACPPAAMKD